MWTPLLTSPTRRTCAVVVTRRLANGRRFPLSLSLSHTHTHTLTPFILIVLQVLWMIALIRRLLEKRETHTQRRRERVRQRERNEAYDPQNPNNPYNPNNRKGLKNADNANNLRNSNNANKSSRPGDPCNRLVVLDIGGGRGDLGIALAASFAAQTTPCHPQQEKKDLINPDKPDNAKMHVTVLDNNASSLEAGLLLFSFLFFFSFSFSFSCVRIWYAGIGRRRAEEAGLEDSMTFALCDLSRPDQVQALLQALQATGELVLVLGLHCCGGLTEAAMQLAVTARVPFCVCSCCFMSHPSLAALSRLADQIAPSMSKGHYTSQRHAADRRSVAKLAVAYQAEGQHRYDCS